MPARSRKPWRRQAIRLAKAAGTNTGQGVDDKMRTVTPNTPQENFPTLNDPSTRQWRHPDLMEATIESLTKQQDELNAELMDITFGKLIIVQTCQQQQCDTEGDQVKEIRKKLAAIGYELRVREQAISPAESGGPCTCKNCCPSKPYLDGMDDEPHRQWLISGRG